MFPKKKRVCFVPQKGLGAVHSKVQPKTGFFILFLNKLPNNYRSRLDGGGARPCSIPGSPRNIPVENNEVHMSRNPTSLLSLGPKALAHLFWFFFHMPP